MAFDLAAATDSDLSDEGVWCDIWHPSEQEPVAQIKLYGPYSGAQRDFMRQVERDALRKAQQGRNRHKPRGVADEDETADLMFRLTVALTADWQGLVEKGKPVPCSAEQVERIYRTYPWIYEQARDFVSEAANFFRPPRPNGRDARPPADGAERAGRKRHDESPTPPTGG